MAGPLTGVGAGAARRRRPRWWAVALLVAVVNLPLVHSLWTSTRLDAEGERVTVTVVESAELPPRDDPHWWVAFRYPEAVDPDQRSWPVELERGTWEAVVARGSMDVVVLPGQPAAYEVAGEVPRRLGLLVTLGANAIIVVVVLLAWRFRRGGPGAPAEERVRALGDVERCRPGAAWSVDDDGLVEVRGEVVEVRDDGLVLDLGDRLVTVELDGHRNPVGHQQPARVRGRLV